MDTPSRLRAAAAQAFNTDGFFGTDTNRIAKAAGFSPQTFYRHFADKVDIFVAVYRDWAFEEEKALGAIFSGLGGKDASAWAHEAAAVLMEHHARWRVFRRSLRWLTVENAEVRSARAAARTRQADRLCALAGAGPAGRARALAAILSIEAACDAYADLVTEDLGLSADAWLAEIAHLLERALARG